METSYRKLELSADDAVLVHEGEDDYAIQNLIIQDLKVVDNWFCLNKLSFNIGKTTHMIFYKLSEEPENVHILLI